ncbi:hypothetical protein PHYSODRAFT_334742 [Phytophthora sojae]|uniref:Uncharacterized protein n=1 Tax=Phytophthora sojae (strain P6497) TaxID=1094619 RepID=G4ZTE0_PHYSP|nr:hypothetical protein PHYSODRAFT_334742 [Phytophthora sojae]EGZ12904.1 hypothetical protein PHYSODRAFT_334742 [Phytophthora sojae]|eukprot:XP_009530333.1 hypothetical protein PHYSODRAFT_334742 [Phytophthora sojae]
MRMVGPVVALRAMVELARSKRQRNRASSMATSEEAPETAEATRINSEICVLDDSFVEREQEEGSADRPTTLGKKRVRLRFDGGRRVFAVRRHQFTQWRSQATNSAARTLRGCYTLAQQELTAWRNRSKVASAATDTTPTRHRASSPRQSHDLKRPRATSRSPAFSGTSISSSLSSVTDLEEERRKEIQRSEFSLDERQTKRKPSQCGFAETTCGSHERLLLVNALPLNDSDDEDAEGSSTPRHLPYRKTVIDGRLDIVKNQWV